MYLAAKKLGRSQLGDKPTTAMTRDCPPLPVRVLIVRVLIANATAGRDAIVERGRQAGVVARPERQTVAVEVGIAAEHPVSRFDPQRRRTIVETTVRQVARDLVVEDELAAREVRVLIEQCTGAAAPVATGPRGRNRRRSRNRRGTCDRANAADAVRHAAEIRIPAGAEDLASSA